MAAFKQIAMRLGVARCSLADITPQYHAFTSTSQARSIVELLRTAVMTEHECSMAMDLVTLCNWHGGDGQMVAEAVLSKSSAPKSRKRSKESSMQDFSSFIDYCTESQWSLLLLESVGFSAKRDLIICILISLGCRNMDEKTAKLAASLLLLLTRGLEKCMTLLPAQKALTKQDFKEEFKRQARARPSPSSFLSTLPSAWGTLRSESPDLFGEVYKSGELPVKCKVDVQHLQQVDSSYRCRGASKGAQAAPSAAVVSLTQAPTQLEQMGNMVMQGMAQMYQQQQQMYAQQQQLQQNMMVVMQGRSSDSSAASGARLMLNGLQALPAYSGAGSFGSGSEEQGKAAAAEATAATQAAASSVRGEALALQDIKPAGAEKTQPTQPTFDALVPFGKCGATVTAATEETTGAASAASLQSLLIARAKKAAAEKEKAMVFYRISCQCFVLKTGCNNCF